MQAALWERRELVKTYGIRGTVHLFPAQEHSLWMAALRARRPHDARRLTALGLDENKLARLMEAVGDALDGQARTLEELDTALERRLGSWVMRPVPAFTGLWPCWRMTLGHLAAEGVLCFGPNRGRLVTYVRPDHWLDGWSDIDPKAALFEVFRRYLHAYGPARPYDFARWFTLDPKKANALADELSEELVTIDVEGYQGVLLRADASQFSQAGNTSVRLLPHYDCYGIGCWPRERVFPGRAAGRALHRGAAGANALLLIDGQVAGVWERERRGRRLIIRVEPTLRLSAEQRAAVEIEVQRLGEILEGTAELVFADVRLRPPVRS